MLILYVRKKNNFRKQKKSLLDKLRQGITIWYNKGKKEYEPGYWQGYS